MPEILLKKLDPKWTISNWPSIDGHAVNKVVLADLPDKSGIYEVMGYRLDLNLRGIRYQAPQERIRTARRSILVGDPGDWATPDDFQQEDYQYTENS